MPPSDLRRPEPPLDRSAEGASASSRQREGEGSPSGRPAGPGQGRDEAALREGRIAWLGRRSYGPMLALQTELAAARAEGRVGDTVLLLEHEPVITLGRNAREEHVVGSAIDLDRERIEVVRTNRGGDVTFHGPGQLVGYPILDLKPDRCDVRRYVRSLASLMIALLAPWQIAAGTVPGLVGVWVDESEPSRWPGPDGARRLAKIGAIGVRLSNWVSMHGFALNLRVGLDAYRWIVPCGIRAHGVTSVADLTGRAPDVAEVARSAGRAVGDALGLRCAAVEDWADLALDAVLDRLARPPPRG